MESLDGRFFEECHGRALVLARIEQYTGTTLKAQGASFLVGIGHGATHWIIATVFVLLPYLAKDLSLSYTQAGMLASLFHISSFSANIGSGAVVDISGQRVLIQTLSLTIGALALISVGLASTISVLIMSIIVIGMSNNIWHPAAITFLSRRYPKNKGLALSIHTLGATFGDVMAPLFAGTLLLILSWHGVATVSAFPVFMVAAAILFFLRDAEREAQGQGNRHVGLRTYITGLKQLFRNKAMMGVCITTGFRAMAQNGLQVFLPLYLVGVMAANPLVLGLAMMGLQIGGVVVGPVAGIWSDRIGRRPVILVGSAATTILLASLTLVDELIPFVALIFLLGFAIFSLRPVIHSWVMDLASDDVSGSAVSVLFGIQSGFTSLVPIVGGILADIWGLSAVFYLFTAVMAISTVFAYLIPDAKSGSGNINQSL